jgi:hypothetical protein
LQVLQLSVQAVSQQNPSTHDRVWHCPPEVQLAPRARSGGGPASGGTFPPPPIPPTSSVPTIPPVFFGAGLFPEQAPSATDASNTTTRSLARMAATIHLEIRWILVCVSQRIGFKVSKLFNKIA